MKNITRRDFLASCAASAVFLAAPGLYAGPMNDFGRGGHPLVCKLKG